MHRVELKDLEQFVGELQEVLVPNAPCGVESQYSYHCVDCFFVVPNAPCGVES